MVFSRIITAIIIFLSLSSYSETKTASVDFFNKTIPVFFDSSILIDFPYKPNDDGYFEIYYERMESTLYEVLLKDLQAQKQELRLNDWLYFLLLKKSVVSILHLQKEYMQNLFLWFLLNKSGYETQLEFKGKEITVSVFSYDLVYGVPQNKGKGGYFVDLTSFGNTIDYKKWEPFRLSFNPNKGAKTIPFSFTIKQIPKIFENVFVEKEFVFSHNEKNYSIKVTLDSNYAEFLKDYPELSVLKHSEMVLSPKANNTLIPFFKEHTAGMDSVQTVRFLMSFCRTAFKFKKDEQAFAETPYFGGAGVKVIFSPEESLINKYVDSEDISVLFYYLLREVLNPEIILLKYGKRISVAVHLHKKIGIPVMYNAKPYSVCDVSENDNSLEIGQLPKLLAGKSPSVIEK